MHLCFYLFFMILSYYYFWNYLWCFMNKSWFPTLRLLPLERSHNLAFNILVCCFAQALTLMIICLWWAWGGFMTFLEARLGMALSSLLGQYNCSEVDVRVSTWNWLMLYSPLPRQSSCLLSLFYWLMFEIYEFSFVFTR